LAKEDKDNDLLQATRTAENVHLFFVLFHEADYFGMLNTKNNWIKPNKFLKKWTTNNNNWLAKHD
jgi:hypothetical protein